MLILILLVDYHQTQDSYGSTSWSSLTHPCVTQDNDCQSRHTHAAGHGPCAAPSVSPELLNSKTLSTGSESGPSSFALPLLLNRTQCDNPRKQCPALLSTAPKVETFLSCNVHYSHLQLPRASLGHPVSLLQLPLSLPSTRFL